MAQYALYHGNEEWVLKGIAVDLERSLRALGVSTVRSDALKSRGLLQNFIYLFSRDNC